MDLDKPDGRDTRDGLGALDSFEDSRLMLLVKGGTRGAFVVLVRRHQQSLLNFFRRMGARMDEAEDMAQETFLRVFNYRARYEPTGKFTNFLFVLARHAWADAGRKAKRRPESPDEALEARPDPDERHVARSDAKLDVEGALGTLSEKLRAVVVLSVFEGKDYRDVAEALDIPVGTVKSRMHLAMRALKEALNVEAAGTDRR